MRYAMAMLQAPQGAARLGRAGRAAALASAPLATQAAARSIRTSSGPGPLLPAAPSQPRRRRRRQRPLPPAASQQQQQPSDNGPEALASEFSAFLNEQGIPELLRDRRPTHLMSPLACIAAQLGALQVEMGGAWCSAALACSAVCDACRRLLRSLASCRASPLCAARAASACCPRRGCRLPRALASLPSPLTLARPAPALPLAACLQRNDWPEQDAGVQTAFLFAMPQGADELLSAQVSGKWAVAAALP